MEATTEVKVEEVEEPAPSGKVATLRPVTTMTHIAPDSMTGMLFGLAERGAPVEQLKELVLLHEHMQDRDAKRAYFAALAAFQEEVGPVVKRRQADFATREGSGMKYSYANADDILKDVRPTMLKHGLSVKFDQDLVNGTQCKCICTLMHVDGHSETSSFTVPTESRAGMSPQQKVGAAMSYGQARVLGIALGITTTEGEPEGVDPTPISQEQLDEIDELLHAKGIDPARVLKFAGVEALKDIRAVDFLRVITTLERVTPPKKGGAQ